MSSILGDVITISGWVLLALWAVMMAHGLIVFLLSRRIKPALREPSSNMAFVFLVPCMNEERVIGATVQSLLAFDQGRWAGAVGVVIIDDDSSDGTADVLAEFADDPRVYVLRRRAPNAQLGKGHALNAAYRWLLRSPWNAGRAELVVAIIDADGRLEPSALDRVAPYLADPAVAGVQIGVKIRNAPEHLLARFQDVEFGLFTDVIQTGRNRLSSPSLGGNGQFTRLDALQDLGAEPWSSCLTEDLEVGLRLILEGHELRHCPTTWVDQQGLTSVSRWIRQRTRWFQGHLQCRGYIIDLWRSDLPFRVKADLAYHLAGPVLMLVTSLAVVIGWIAMAAQLIVEPAGTLAGLSSPQGALAYAIAFTPCPVVALVLWRREPEMGFLRGLTIAHLYLVYCGLWFISGWKGVVRTVRGQGAWAKTDRLMESAHPEPWLDAAAPVSAAARQAEAA
ncbi:MAG: glycosyltransferase family 2 protein [Acidimicrobiales bacterium]